MKLSPLVACMAVLSLTACAHPPIPSGLPSEPNTASLSLSLDQGRKAQALGSDVTSAAVTVAIPDQMPRTFKFSVSGETALDLKDLPRGDAMVHVDAFDKNNLKIGEGDQAVALRTGLRTYASVSVLLSTEGKTDYVPLIPLD